MHGFEKQLVLVEYPGVVENEDRAVRTLGGLQNISTTYSLKNRRLELRFRPDDAFSKPACGDRHRTMSLLIKVKVCQKSKTIQYFSDSSSEDSTLNSSDNNHEKKTENIANSVIVVGRIETAYRFRNLCDFQYVAMDPECNNGSTVCNYSHLVPTGLPTSFWLVGEAPYFLPPATFSRMDTMQVLTFLSLKIIAISMTLAWIMSYLGPNTCEQGYSTFGLTLNYVTWPRILGEVEQDIKPVQWM